MKSSINLNCFTTSEFPVEISDTEIKIPESPIPEDPFLLLSWAPSRTARTYGHPSPHCSPSIHHHHPQKPPLDHPACFSLYTPLGQDFWTGILDCWASRTCIRNVEDYGSHYRIATFREGLSKRGGLRGLTLIWVSFKQMLHIRRNY